MPLQIIEHMVSSTIDSVAVVIPSCGRIASLANTISSLTTQIITGCAFDIIVVDNTLPASSAIQDHFGGGVCTVIREDKVGLHYARHAAALHCSASIIVYIDDDVECPDGWLHEMLRPFEDPAVALVGGESRLKCEADFPDWLQKYRMYLSERIESDGSGYREPYWAPVGCNMAVRRSILFEVAGFNPDGFGRDDLLQYRGDGENGLARKIHEAGHRSFYSSEAWLYHVVPTSRLTREYLERRLMLCGLEQAYSYYRYRRPSYLRLLVHYIKTLICSTKALPPAGDEEVDQSIERSRSSAYLNQLSRLLLSRKLREFTVRPTYFDV